LAGELHDSLGQNLSLIKNRTHLALQQTGVPPETVSHLEAIRRIVSDAISEVRNLAHNLRPLHIEQLGLTDSLGILIEEVAQSANIPIARRLENVDDLFKGEAAANVYRIVQESLNNLVKHAQARRAEVTLERDITCARLRVNDDGCGFDARQALAKGGLGLTSLRERARMLGGSVEIHSAPGQGTELFVELPFSIDESEQSAWQPHL
jgi:signal transduction histidine kinase